jgi:hypothetical protein
MSELFAYAPPCAPHHLHWAGIRKPSQKRTHELHKPGGGEKPGEALCQLAPSQLLAFPFAPQMKPPSGAPDHENCGREEKQQR